VTWVSIEELTLDYYKFLEIPNQTISLYVYINPIQAQRVWAAQAPPHTLWALCNSAKFKKQTQNLYRPLRSRYRFWVRQIPCYSNGKTEFSTKEQNGYAILFF
jgi:hypothetical protein